MRPVLAACLCLALIASGCAPSRSTMLPATAAAATVVSQPLSRATHRTPVAAPAPTAAPTVSRATPVTARSVPALDGLLDGVLPEELAGAQFSLVLEDLSSGVRTTLNADQSLPSASLYKLGVAWATMRQVDAGTLQLSSQLEITDDDAVEPEPDGGVGVGDTPTLEEALQAMLSVSSNAAAHALLRTLGRDGFTQEMDRIGLQHTRVPDDGLAVTSATDMARLLRLIATSPELTQGSRALIAQAMSSTAPPDALRDTLPDDIGIFDKTGNLDDASNVGALLESPRATAILVVIDTGVDPGDARAVIAQAGQIAYRALLQ
jgi:beta-lactamase class A